MYEEVSMMIMVFIKNIFTHQTKIFALYELICL